MQKAMVAGQAAEWANEEEPEKSFFGNSVSLGTADSRTVASGTIHLAVLSFLSEQSKPTPTPYKG